MINRVKHLLLLFVLLTASLALYRYTLSIPDSPVQAEMMPLSGVLGATGVAGLFQFFLVVVHEYCLRRLSGGKNAG
ncbi:hypothetical protein ACM4N5_003782 [Escherichia coli]|uniref:hypothetical protein n=1 Tax=Enterobacteriaceae TaxID=543 RepID=UPI000F5D931F|nr:MULTISPECIES: hypothetical protein [Enterobacteriaceae]HBR1132750.1 hypothetical protein [Klebsiella quasipneumoniae subsp. similipneumoniae]HCM5085202.1 hypothetical protein [Klebsiella aerogenes]HDX4249228.1 hypothetical protein [Klebsiella oxytoca]MBL1695118.1 hypothetical protein [Klebsiella pneumoniae]MBL2251684.1 hypothetical protein [Klebsiella pneumoniae]